MQDIDLYRPSLVRVMLYAGSGNTMVPHDFHKEDTRAPEDVQMIVLPSVQVVCTFLSLYQCVAHMYLMACTFAHFGHSCT
jgi:hypothetical protein